MTYKLYDMQTNRRSTIIGSEPPKSQKNKHKGITKPLKSQGDLGLDKSTSRSDKRRFRGTQQWMDEWQVERVFNVHGCSKIDFSQSLLSLRLLGCLIEDGENSAFKALWKEHNQDSIDLSVLQDFYLKLKNKEKQQGMRQLFMLLSGGSLAISENTLKTMAQEVGWKGEVGNILEQTGTAGSLSLEEFSRVINAHSALF